jgi:hypothetical protein
MSFEDTVCSVKALSDEVRLGLADAYEQGVSIMDLADAYELHPDIVALAARGYGYKRMQLNGTRWLYPPDRTRVKSRKKVRISSRFSRRLQVVM